MLLTTRVALRLRLRLRCYASRARCCPSATSTSIPELVSTNTVNTYLYVTLLQLSRVYLLA